LFPFGLIYRLITGIRNWLFDQGRIYSRRYKYPVIVVGNLSVGGTGKTPMVQWLVQFLKNDFNPAMISRGYGRSTRGFRLAHTGDTASTIGDEAMQLFKHFKGTVPMLVAEKRTDALDTINDKGNKVAVLDDAFQHRSVKASLNIMLTDYNRLFCDDFIMPIGLLRESRWGARRADVIVVTKCPDKIDGGEWEKIVDRIKKYSGEYCFVIASRIQYLAPYNFNGDGLETGQKVFLISGLANPNSLIERAKQKFSVMGEKHFSDHYRYKRQDIDLILEMAGQCPIICTEKDYMKLYAYPQLQGKLFAWPIGIEFLNGEVQLKELIIESIINLRSSVSQNVRKRKK